jgi:TonB family protein
VIRYAGAAWVALVILTSGCTHQIAAAPIPPTSHEYLDTVKSPIRNKWTFPCVYHPGTGACEHRTARVLVELGIHKNGKLAYVKLVTPSGHPTLDDGAVQAVTAADPFPPVPDSLSKTGIRVRATMDYEGRDGELYWRTK